MKFDKCAKRSCIINSEYVEFNLNLNLENIKQNVDLINEIIQETDYERKLQSG